MVLNAELKQRVVELADQSGKMGKDGYEIREFAGGRNKGDKGVFYNNTPIYAGRLLPLIKP